MRHNGEKKYKFKNLLNNKKCYCIFLRYILQTYYLNLILKNKENLLIALRYISFKTKGPIQSINYFHNPKTLIQLETDLN